MGNFTRFPIIPNYVTQCSTHVLSGRSNIQIFAKVDALQLYWSPLFRVFSISIWATWRRAKSKKPFCICYRPLVFQTAHIIGVSLSWYWPWTSALLILIQSINTASRGLCAKSAPWPSFWRSWSERREQIDVIGPDSSIGFRLYVVPMRKARKQVL